MRKRKPLCCGVCAHFKLVCIRLRGYGGVGVFSWTVAMITRGHRCSRLTLTCRLRVLHSPPLLHLEKKKKSIPLPHLGACVGEINLGGCWVLLTYQPKSILLTGTEMMALSLTGRVSKQQT